MTQRLKSAICQIALLCGTLPLFLAADDRPRLSEVTIKSIVEYRLHKTGMQRENKLQVMVDDHGLVRCANRPLPPIPIIVHNGKDFLKRAVANQVDKQLAESLVRTEVLSVDVVNELTVDSQNASRS